MASGSRARGRIGGKLPLAGSQRGDFPLRRLRVSASNKTKSQDQKLPTCSSLSVFSWPLTRIDRGKKTVERQGTNWLILLYSTTNMQIDYVLEQLNQISGGRRRRMGSSLVVHTRDSVVNRPSPHRFPAYVQSRLGLAPACSCSPRRAPWQQG